MTGPTLLLVAAPRSGSTQLARWLGTHPQITLAPVKEPNHFSAHEFGPGADRDLNEITPGARPIRPGQFAIFRDPADYAALFTGMTTPWRFEASTTYLACPEAPGLIRAALPDIRIILLTRDPVARAVSHYRLARRTGRVTAPLGAELAAECAGDVPLWARYLLRPSRQQAGLDRFRAAFPAAQRTELRFEDLTADPAAALARLAAFLGIDPAGFDLRAEARNAGVAPRFPALNAALQRSGVKPRLRRLLPAPIKARVKPIWFDATRRIDISPSDLAALRRALEAR